MPRKSKVTTRRPPDASSGSTGDQSAATPPQPGISTRAALPLSPGVHEYAMRVPSALSAVDDDDVVVASARRRAERKGIIAFFFVAADARPSKAGLNETRLPGSRDGGASEGGGAKICVIQILPYLVGERYVGAFPSMARQRGFRYVELRTTNRSLSTFHWEHAPRAAREANREGRDRWLDARADPFGADHVAHVSNAELYSFWINQDIRVPAADWRAALLDCDREKEAR